MSPLEWLGSVELPVLYWMQETLKCGFLDGLCWLLSIAFELGIPWFIIAIILFVRKKTRAWGVVLFCAVVVTFFFGEVIIKEAVGRVRPCAVDETVRLIVERPSSFSFPSGHTGTCFAAAVTLMFADKRLGIPALVLAVVMAFSRMYLFVHFPTDVLAGAVFGSLVAWGTVKVFRESGFDTKINEFDFKIRRN